MARKKKVKQAEIVDTFVPSTYQQNIFDYILNEHGNLLIEACAGSGKTKTLTEIIKLIDPSKRILFCAFNKDIVKDITKKTQGFTNVDVRTIHSLGLLMLRNNLGRVIVPNETKYESYLKSNLKKLTTTSIFSLGRKKYYNYINNIIRLFGYFRYNLCQTEKDCEGLIRKYGIEIIADEVSIVLHLAEWGKSFLEEIDYTDMVWLPTVLNLQPYGLQFDYILVDECQDLSTAQRELVLRCKKMGTRYVFAGDQHQAIYGFASSDVESFAKISQITNMKALPLSISYRCDKRIVNFAKCIVNVIEENKDNADGEILFDAKIQDVQDGDMILCRNNAPLIKLYNDLLKLGRKCSIKGKDIGLNLKKMVEETNNEILNVDLNKEGVFLELYKALFTKRNEIMRDRNLDLRSANETSDISTYLDQIRALEAISEGLTTKEELVSRIERMFTDKKEEGISLSTIHKAKGLEADNVYIACRSLMPCKSATLDWEKEQEKNLQYVAYTRAKHKLAFLNEDDFKKYLTSASDSLAKIEAIVNMHYGIKSSGEMLSNRQYTETIIKRATVLTPPKKGKNISIGTRPKTPTSGLTNLRNNKIKYKI